MAGVVDASADSKLRSTLGAPDKKISKTFRTESEAKSWRAEAKRSLDRGILRAPGQRTIREAGETWLVGAERGEIRSRSGRPFKPSFLRGYRQAFTDRIVPAVGISR